MYLQAQALQSSFKHKITIAIKKKKEEIMISTQALGVWGTLPWKAKLSRGKNQAVWGLGTPEYPSPYQINYLFDKYTGKILKMWPYVGC